MNFSHVTLPIYVMRNGRKNKFILFRSFLLSCILFSFTACISTASVPLDKSSASEVDSGYSALLLFLENQQHLTLLRRIRSFLTLQDISDESTKLLDSISESSAKAHDELEKLAKKKPAVVIQKFSDNSIGKATFDSLRMTTAKELMLDSKNFEKNLLFSQTQMLRLISHLAEELKEHESNEKRKAWLIALSKRYEEYYVRIYKRMALV